MYTLDTEAEATVVASAPTTSPSADDAVEDEPTPSVAAATEPIATATEAPPVSSSPSPQHRTPTIRFLGKQGWADLLSGKKQEPSAPLSPTDTMSVMVNAIHPMYGRPPFTEEEMDALIFGGANLVE